MKKINFLIIGLILLMAGCETKNPENLVKDNLDTELREFYQLKTYTLNSEDQVRTTESYLKDAYLPALKKLGIKQVGIFKPRPNESDSIKKIFVLIPFSSMSQFLNLEEELSNDETYLENGNDYLNASINQVPYDRIESILLKAFKDMPVMKTPTLEGPRSNRIYELRSYESPTERYYRNKVDMFNAGGEIRLFERLEFNAVFYGEVISGPKMPNLMYMTTFADQSSHDEHWKAFVDSPEWKELIAMPKYKNNVSHADIYLLYPTEYSDY